MKRYNISTAERIHNWAHDVNGMNARTLEIVEPVLAATTKINDYWREDYYYKESEKNEVIFSSSIPRKYNKIKELYGTHEFQTKVAEFSLLYDTQEQAQLVAVYYYLQLFGISRDLNEAARLYRKLQELETLRYVSQDVRKKAIMEHYIEIYGECRYISVIRLKNGVYKNSIGDYEDVEAILGKDGEFLRLGRDDAIDYVLTYEAFENKLSAIKAEIEFQIERSKPIEYFR